MKKDIKDKIADLWAGDPELNVLAGETFDRAWLDDPVILARMETFLTRLRGHIVDATYHLPESARADIINRIQSENKDRIWSEGLYHTATDDEMPARLDRIHQALVSMADYSSQKE